MDCSTVLVYCDMNGINCGGKGGWTRVDVNMPQLRGGMTRVPHHTCTSITICDAIDCNWGTVRYVCRTSSGHNLVLHLYLRTRIRATARILSKTTRLHVTLTHCTPACTTCSLGMCNKAPLIMAHLIYILLSKNSRHAVMIMFRRWPSLMYKKSHHQHTNSLIVRQSGVRG